jgi:hypothetical protein
MKKIIAIAFLFLSLIFFTSCDNSIKKVSQKEISNSVDSSNIESVEIVSLKTLKSTELYTKNCKFCHGSYGKGDGVKARLDPKICPYDLSKEHKPDKFVYYVILNGQDKMPSHEKLNEENIRILIVYIKKFKN